MRRHEPAPVLDAVNRILINMLQGGFPVSSSPYQEVANKLGISEDELLWRLEVMKTDGIYSRFGPLYNAEALGGAVTLAAMEVPEKRFEAVAEQVNRHQEVAHNYQRAHHHNPTRFNMWFVISTETQEEIAPVIARIEAETGLKVYNMPKQREYFLELKFQL
jgi:DNA-binding Lrp family transcriptional regulator